MHNDRSVTFRNAIFAGGGSRCFWQIGFWEGAKQAGVELQSSVKFVGSTSAGCAMATAAVLDRAHEALHLFKDLTARNPRNIHWDKVSPLKPGTVLPHPRMYREALRAFVGPAELRTLKRTSVHVLMSVYPSWLKGTLGTAAAFFIYGVESLLRSDAIHPSWPTKAGFRPLVGRAADCRTPEEFVDMVLAASRIPPILPEGRFGDRRVLDGGFIEHIPVRLAQNQPGETLVLLSQRYERSLPKQDGVTWVQPSAPIKIDKFDYANPEGLQETFDLGLRDGRAFGRGCVLSGRAYSSAQWRDPS